MGSIPAVGAKGSHMSDKTLADLKQRFPNRVLLSPDDIADVISTSVAVQANMRARGTFPLPIIKTGRKVGVNIYHLADYLNGKPVVAVSAPVLTSKTSDSTPAKRARRGAKDWLVAPTCLLF